MKKFISKKSFFYFFALIFSVTALAEDGGSSAESWDKQALLVSSFLYLAYALAFIGGLFALKSAISGFLNYQEESQRGEGGAGRKIIIRLMIAGVLLDPQASIDTMMKTVGIKEADGLSYCYAYDPTFLNDFKSTRNKDVESDLSDSDYVSTSSKAKGCIEEPLNILQEKLGDKVNEDGSIWQMISTQKHFTFLVGVLQTIAIFFYFNAWFKIWAISDGKDRQSTYKGQVLTIIFSSFVINLPKTIEVIINTFSGLI